MAERVMMLARPIEVAGAGVVAWYVARACLAATRVQGAMVARVLVADGVLAALSRMVTATLLKTIALHGWHQIGMFTFVLALRSRFGKVPELCDGSDPWLLDA